MASLLVAAHAVNIISHTTSIYACSGWDVCVILRVGVIHAANTN